MSARNLLSVVFMFACFIQVGCAGCLHCARHGGGWGMGEASCACPDCGCADACCDVGCGCPEPSCCCAEPACGCCDPCCDPCCGAPGCGTMVGSRFPLASCPLLRGLRNLFCGCGCSNGCGEAYYGDWHCNPPCCEPCDQCGNYTGAQYSMPMGRQPYVASRVKADQIRFSNGNNKPVRR